MKEKASIIFQFVLLIALVAMDGYILYTTGVPDETITGILAGLAVGIGLTTVNE